MPRRIHFNWHFVQLAKSHLTHQADFVFLCLSNIHWILGMKYTFLLLAVFFCYGPVQAQDSTVRTKYKWALCMELSNFGPDEQTNPLLVPFSYSETAYALRAYSSTFGLTLSRTISPSGSLRLRLGYAHPVQTSEVDGSRTIHTVSGQVIDPGYYMLEHLVTEEQVGFVAIGFSKELLKTHRISLHAGVEGVFLKYWGKKAESDILEYDSPGNGPYINRNEKYIHTGEEAYAVGLNVFSGVDIHLCKRVKLGAELSLAYLYNKLYGSRMEYYHSYTAQYPQQVAPFGIPQHHESVGFSPVRISMHLTWLF
jgi:hypothetical protein